MVTIPTTDRQFYDNEKKTNTLQTYSDAIKPAIDELNTIYKEQEMLKIKASLAMAGYEIQDITEKWRNENKNNLLDVDARNALNAEYEQILANGKTKIDPMYRNEYDIQANELKQRLNKSNFDWIVKQRNSNANTDAEILSKQKINDLYNQARSGVSPDKIMEGYKAWINADIINNPALTYQQIAKILAQNDKDIPNALIAGYVANRNFDMARDVNYRLSEPKNQIKNTKTIDDAKFKNDYEYVLQFPQDIEAINALLNEYSGRLTDKQKKNIETARSEYEDKIRINKYEQANELVENIVSQANNINNYAVLNRDKEREIETKYFYDILATFNGIEDSNLDQEEKEKLQRRMYTAVYNGVFANNWGKIIDYRIKALNNIANNVNYLDENGKTTLKTFRESNDANEVLRNIPEAINSKNILNSAKQIVARYTDEAVTHYMNAVNATDKMTLDNETALAERKIAECNLTLATLINPNFPVDKIKNGEIKKGDYFIYEPTGERYMYEGNEYGNIYIVVE